MFTEILFFALLIGILIFKWINRPEKEFTVPDRTSTFSVKFSNIAKQGYTGYSGHAGCIVERGRICSPGVQRKNMMDGGQPIA